MADGTSVILHADMDAFYAAIEQRDRPELRGQPVIVSGHSARAVVLTASYEARPYGVHSAMPAIEARRRCPQGVFVAPRMRHYTAVGAEVRSVFREFTPLIEPLSLDEAFLDVTASQRLFGAPREIGRRLKARMLEATGLVVSVGIAPTKMVAKIASALCKPDGLLQVAKEDVVSLLEPLPVNQIWGVGPKTHATLLRLGIATVGDLARCDAKRLASLGDLGHALAALARGDDGRTVDADWQRRSYGEETTFERDRRDGEALRQTILGQADAIARRLRADGRSGRTVTLKMKLTTPLGGGKYPVITRRTTLPEPTDDGGLIGRAALALWDQAHHGTVVRLIGVSVSGIAAPSGAQLALFAPERAARSAALNRALDQIAERFGTRALRRGRTDD